MWMFDSFDRETMDHGMLLYGFRCRDRKMDEWKDEKMKRKMNVEE